MEQPSASGHRQRLRERFRKDGFDGFADYEVVELLLTLAIPYKDVKQPAKRLIAKFGDPESLFRFWRARIGPLKDEVFEVGYLDSAWQLLRDGIQRLKEGTTDRASVYRRRVIEAALRRKAAGLVFAYNHPNGNVQPSEQDKVLTRALVLAAATVEMKVLDHLIVAPDAVFSFSKEGLL